MLSSEAAPASCGRGLRPAEQHEPGHRDEAKRRDRAASRVRREDQLEQRNRISEAHLKWPKRAIPVVRGDEGALGDKCGNGQAKPAIASTRNGAPPDDAVRNATVMARGPPEKPALPVTDAQLPRS